MTGSIATVGTAACYINTNPQPNTPPGTAPSATAAAPSTPATAPPTTPPSTPAPSATSVHLRPGGGGGNPPTPAACLDNGAAAAGDCSSLASNATAKAKCDAYNNNYNPKVAAQAVSCLTKSSNPSGDIYTCGKTALGMACADANVTQACSQVTAVCKSETATSCAAYLNGLNANGRQKVAACAASNGCANGLYSCIEGLQ